MSRDQSVIGHFPFLRISLARSRKEGEQVAKPVRNRSVGATSVQKQNGACTVFVAGEKQSFLQSCNAQEGNLLEALPSSL